MPEPAITPAPTTQPTPISTAVVPSPTVPNEKPAELQPAKKSRIVKTNAVPTSSSARVTTPPIGTAPSNPANGGVPLTTATTPVETKTLPPPTDSKKQKLPKGGNKPANPAPNASKDVRNATTASATTTTTTTTTTVARNSSIQRSITFVTDGLQSDAVGQVKPNKQPAISTTNLALNATPSDVQIARTVKGRGALTGISSQSSICIDVDNTAASSNTTGAIPIASNSVAIANALAGIKKQTKIEQANRKSEPESDWKSLVFQVKRMESDTGTCLD